MRALPIAKLLPPCDKRLQGNNRERGGKEGEKTERGGSHIDDGWVKPN
jgi:hypothetical protein